MTTFDLSGRYAATIRGDRTIIHDRETGVRENIPTATFLQILENQGLATI